jgi:drug/metabolite transporter (DMT)-like permease
MILVIILYAICGSMFTLSKAALLYCKPLFYIGMRMVGAGIILGSYYLIQIKTMREKFVFSWSDWPLLLQVIIFHIYLTFICDICPLTEITSIESAFIYNLSPFVAALFSYFWFSEVMTWKKWLGLSIGFIALIPELAKEITGPVISPKLMPKLVTVGAVIFSAYGWIILRKLIKDKGYSTFFVNGIGMFFGGVLAFLTSYFTESWCQPVTSWIPFIKLTLSIIVISNIIFYNLYGYLLKYYTATFLSFAGFLCPIFTALFGWFFLGESVSIGLLISFCIVSIGLYIFYHEELRQGYIND